MQRRLYNIHALVRNHVGGSVRCFLQRHRRWRQANGEPYLTLPTKKTVASPGSEEWDGTSVEGFVDDVMQHDLGLAACEYALDQEFEPVAVNVVSPAEGVQTRYEVYPLDVWVEPECRGRLADRVGGEWLSPVEVVDDARVSPTAKAVFEELLQREQQLNEQYQNAPDEERRPEAPRRLLADVPDRPNMNALARRWHAQNRGGVRILTRKDCDAILDSGDRAFNLLVADPYLRYQNQGCGLTWAFFTHKDGQDLHVHGAPTVEIYGVLSGRLEMWWKPYHARGASAWSRRILGPLDWAEVGPMQCHIVRWLGEGVGVVFKASSGPLAGVGPIGVCGKTKCAGCRCQKPPEVVDLELLFQ